MNVNKIVIEHGAKPKVVKINNWDPTETVTNSIPNCPATIRVKKDLVHLFNDPPPGLFVWADEQNIMLIHAIVVGPMETPYEGGFFYFFLRCPNTYPIEPPLVKLMTTDAGHVRFNPNMYKNGKICLSILGTWNGPAWSPAQQLASLLISIQSLMNEKPYYNEPGIQQERHPGEAKMYSDVIAHETLRVAVCGMLENERHLNIPSSLKDVMEKNFMVFYDQYVTNCESKLYMDGQLLQDSFSDNRGIFCYGDILRRLKNIHSRLTHKEAMLKKCPMPKLSVDADTFKVVSLNVDLEETVSLSSDEAIFEPDENDDEASTTSPTI